MSVIAVATGNQDAHATVLRALAQGPHSAVTVSSGVDLLRLLFERSPDAVILDARLPGVEVMELIRAARAASSVPVVLLLATHDAAVVARALDCGADSVVVGGASPAELAARLQATLAERRGAGAEAPRMVRTGSLVIDRSLKRVSRDGLPVRLAEAEYALLHTLALTAGHNVPHSLLLGAIRKGPRPVDRGYVATCVGRLRRKLGDDPRCPQYVISEWGRGYRLALLAAPAERDALHA